MIELDVFLNGIIAGWLRSDDNARFTFRYAPEYLLREDAIPLSCSLPLGKEEFEYPKARAFFAGVLPEETSRNIVADRLSIARNNDIRLADAIGGDCAGAVSLLPAGRCPLPEGTAVSWLSDDEFTEILRRLSDRSLLAPGDHVRLSLAGAMSKLTLCHSEGKFGIPSENTPSTHIIKPGMEGLEDLVFNECFCAMLARKAGLSVPKTEVLEHTAGSFLIIERYDRLNGHRIHQEDFCQALGYPPSDKYQSQGGPGLGECFSLLRRHATRPARDISALARAVVFNILIGNNDAHAKNFSILHHQDGTVCLAPLYDLVSTEVYPRFRNGAMAMKFGGTYDFRWVNPEHLEKFVNETGLGHSVFRKILKTMCAEMPSMAEECAQEMNRPVCLSISNLVHERAALLLKRFQ